MKTYNLKESLIQMDKETDFKYTLTDLYEACQLDEKKKAQLAQYIDAKDPVSMNAMLCNEASVMTENVSDDLADDEMPEGIVAEGWGPDLTDCPACGDLSFDSKRGRCTKCSYRESLIESFQEGDMVWVKPSNKPGRVVSARGEQIEVEIMGGSDPDRRDVFYPEDLEMEVSLNEDALNEGPLSILGDAAGKAVGDAWKGVKNFAKGVKDTAKDVKKTAIEVRDGIKQSKDAAKVRDAWRAMKSSDTVDQFKADYQRRQDARAKSDTKRDQMYKGKTGKSIGDKQDWKFVVNGKKLSYDQFMSLPQKQRHELVAQKKVKVLDLMGRETSFKDHNKRLKEYFLLEDFELEPDYSIYNLTDDQIEQVKFIEKNLDTPTGYKAYYKLMKELTDEGGCMDIFYDLSADFAWDNRLSVALTRIALADNRPDLADPEYLPGGVYSQYMSDPKYANVLLEDATMPNLEATLMSAAEAKLAEMGYEGDFIDEYFGIKLEDTDDNRIKVTVWGELSYEESSELADVLNHIVAEEDPDAYFDHETSGRMAAYIRKDQSEDIPDEALVSEWSEKFNSCTTWEQLKDVYGEFYNIRDDLNNGTHRALYDIIDKKIDELKPVEESLNEESEYPTDRRFYVYDSDDNCISDSFMDKDDAIEYAKENGLNVVKIHNYYIDNDKHYPDGDPKVVWSQLNEDSEEAPAAIYSMLDAADKYVDNDEYPEGASEEEIIEIAKNNPDCMKVTKWVDGQTGPDEVVWERPVDTWFVCQYEGGAEYEHAEGGYYYETLALVDKETFPSKEAARKRLADLADEARKEGEDVVAQTDDYFRIKLGKYIGDCEEYHVEAKEGAHASGKKVYEGLNEAILNEINSPEEKPYSAAEIEKEIKSLTQNFTRKKDNLKCGFKEENDAAVKLLKKHYNKVNSEKHGQWFEITFSEPKKELKEDISDGTITLTSDYFYDNLKNLEDAGWNDVVDFVNASGWVKDGQVIIPAGTILTFNDTNRYFDYYYVMTNAGSFVIPFNKDFTAESPLTEDMNTYNVTFYMDSLDDNVMSGPSTTKMIQASSEEEAKKKLIDSSTDKYYIPTVTKVELVEGVNLREGTKQKRIACTTEFDNGNVIHNDWQKISDEEAEELAKQRSIENPGKVYYVKYDDIMNPCSNYKWKNGQCINESAETSKEWEHKGKDGKIGRIRQSDGKGDRKPLTRDQAKEIANFRGHGDDELYPVNESNNDRVRHYEDMLNKCQSWEEVHDISTQIKNDPKISTDDEYNLRFEVARNFERFNESKSMTADEMKDKYGTDNPDIINAGKPEEERVALKEDSQDKIIANNIEEFCNLLGIEYKRQWGAGLFYPTSWNVYREFEDMLRSAGLGNLPFYYYHPKHDKGDPDAIICVEDDGDENIEYVQVTANSEPIYASGYTPTRQIESVDESKSINEAMTYTDVNGFLGEPGETYTMSQFRRMWQDKDNDPVMSGYDSFEEWVGETISQMDAKEEEPEVAPSGRGKLSTAIFIDTNGIMGTNGGKFTLNDLADYWEANRGSDPVLANYNGDWKKWLDDTIEQMEVSYDSSLFEESFEDMLKDPEVQRKNAEYADKMKAKHDKENELAKEAKNWPDDKELTYEEAMAFAKAYYSQGGDGFYETTEKYQFDDMVDMFGPMTVGSMKRDFNIFDSVAKDRMAEGIQLTEAPDKYELLIEPYERYQQCPLVKKTFNSNSLAKVLETIANRWMYGFDPIERAADEGWECETREEAIEALQKEYDKAYTQILIDELEGCNGDGCGFIFYLKNLTTGDMIIDSGIEPEEEEEDLFESTEEASDASRFIKTFEEE